MISPCDHEAKLQPDSSCICGVAVPGPFLKSPRFTTQRWTSSPPVPSGFFSRQKQVSQAWRPCTSTTLQPRLSSPRNFDGIWKSAGAPCASSQARSSSGFCESFGNSGGLPKNSTTRGASTANETRPGPCGHQIARPTARTTVAASASSARARTGNPTTFSPPRPRARIASTLPAESDFAS